jgi:nucleoside-diphosphate-sugar epimerase
LRDFVSIHDVVACLVLMIEDAGADFLPVNVGSGETVTILEIAKTLNRILGKSIRARGDAGRPQVRHPSQHGRHHPCEDNAWICARVTLDQGFSELVNGRRRRPTSRQTSSIARYDELKQRAARQVVIVTFEQLKEYRQPWHG